MASPGAPSAGRPGTAVLTAAGLSKAYAGIRALRGVSFDVVAGEVHAIVGENGAGKSTLIKILAGAIAPDEGLLDVGGERVTRHDPLAARRRGIAVIYQQPTLFPHLSVAENLSLALDAGSPFARIDWAKRRSDARRLLEAAGASIDPDASADTLSIAEQQMVEIARALSHDARIVIMDEPTASLTVREVDRLLETVRTLRAHGTAVVYISHRLEEVFSLADRITVLRDGERIGTVDARTTDRGSVIQMMIGRAMDIEPGYRTDGTTDPGATSSPTPGHRKDGMTGPGSTSSSVGPGATSSDVAAGSFIPSGMHPAGGVRLQLDRVSSAEGVRDVTLSVHGGEIVGLGGLVGAGRTELARALFGLAPASGRITVDGTVRQISSPADAIAAGLAYVPEDRRKHGVIGELRNGSNLSLASLPRLARLGGWLDRRAEREAGERFIKELDVRPPLLSAATRTLSGGNQQKVALGRWLMTNPSVLILDEPTQGVDIGAKAEIHRHIRRLAGQGTAILVISSDLPELLSLSDRIVVMRGGAITGTLARAEATAETVMRLALGESAA